jgi:hypothetical protein
MSCPVVPPSCADSRLRCRSDGISISSPPVRSSSYPWGDASNMSPHLRRRANPAASWPPSHTQHVTTPRLGQARKTPTHTAHPTMCRRGKPPEIPSHVEASDWGDAGTWEAESRAVTNRRPGQATAPSENPRIPVALLAPRLLVLEARQLVLDEGQHGSRDALGLVRGALDEPLELHRRLR